MTRKKWEKPTVTKLDDGEPELFIAIVLDMRRKNPKHHKEIKAAYDEATGKAYELDGEGRTTTWEVTKFKFIGWSEK